MHRKTFGLVLFFSLTTWISACSLIPLPAAPTPTAPPAATAEQAEPAPTGTSEASPAPTASTTSTPAATKTSTLTPSPTVTPSSTPWLTPEPLANPGLIGWAETAKLPQGVSAPFDDRAGQPLIFHDGFAYLFGGWGPGDNRLTDVHFAAVEPNGALSPWQSAESFPRPYSDHHVVIVGDFVYLLSGADGLADVYYAYMNANGALGAWTPTTPLTLPREEFAAASFGNFIYTSGGNANGVRDFVLYASALPDGGLDPWRVTTALPVPVQAHTMLAYAGYLYVFGGKDSGGQFQRTVHFAPIQPDGSLGDWQPAAALPETMSGFATFESNGTIYLVGGTGSTSYYARVLADHSLDAWRPASGLPSSKILGLHAGAYNGFAYAAGGFKSQYLDTVYYGRIGQQNPPPAVQTSAAASATPPPVTQTPGAQTCFLNAGQEVHVSDGTNLWTFPDVVTGTNTGSLIGGTAVFVLNGPTWGRVTSTGVGGWWWEVSLSADGDSQVWIWEGRIEECK